MLHTFHIPVLGLGYSVDTPIKVAPLGLSSVASIVDDEMIERVRLHYARQAGEEVMPIFKGTFDYRAKRITAYLNLMHRLVQRDFKSIQKEAFDSETRITRYFQMLPDWSKLKMQYEEMQQIEDANLRLEVQDLLRKQMQPGAIDVNIMSKVDKMNHFAGQPLDDIYSDACAALRGFAESTLTSSVVMSAGLNPRLYQYLETLSDFFPDQNGYLKKKVILKVSDFRSALIQAKYLAKRGIWVSEFRIESGLNCGGHAFATEGFLLGPILEEFKLKRQELLEDLFKIYVNALQAKQLAFPDNAPEMKITVQGGIGTAEEDQFLREYYQIDATGWGSPFLLVPEATSVDDATLQKLTDAKPEDYYVSNSSPLGVLFNNFRPSSAEKQRIERIEKGRPGSPCHKKFLVSNTEFTEEPICTASRQYQNLKIKQLQSLDPKPADFDEQMQKVTDKLCLCDGLSTSVLMKYYLLKPRENSAVAICPGPNLAWFKSTYSLDEMVAHIYGKIDILHREDRPHMFVNELLLYVEYLEKEIQNRAVILNEKRRKYLLNFKAQLENGIGYYRDLVMQFAENSSFQLDNMLAGLKAAEFRLTGFDLV